MFVCFLFFFIQVKGGEANTPWVRTRRICWAVPGTRDKNGDKETEAKGAHHTGEGWQLLLDFVSIYTKKGNHFFSAKNPARSSQQESEAQQAWGQGSSGLTTGRPSSPHCLHQDARCAHPVHPPSRGLLEAARLWRSLSGAPEARGMHAPAPRRAAHIQLTRFLVPLLGGWQENYCTSDLGTWEGVGRGGTCLGNGAPVSLFCGLSSGTPVSP